MTNAYNIDTKYTRLIISDKADGMNYQIRNPYEIKRVNYQIGDIIDLVDNNHYAEQINYRFYEENGMATASNVMIHRK